MGTDLLSTYESLPPHQRRLIEDALDQLTSDFASLGITLAGDDRSARAAAALARYVVESRR